MLVAAGTAGTGPAGAIGEVTCERTSLSCPLAWEEAEVEDAGAALAGR